MMQLRFSWPFKKYLGKSNFSNLKMEIKGKCPDLLVRAFLPKQHGFILPLLDKICASLPRIFYFFRHQVVIDRRFCTLVVLMGSCNVAASLTVNCSNMS